MNPENPRTPDKPLYGIVRACGAPLRPQHPRAGRALGENMIEKTLTLSDALTQLPTHESRLAVAERVREITGAFPWGLSDPSDPTQDPAVSAALLLAQLDRAEHGNGALLDLMMPWGWSDEPEEDEEDVAEDAPPEGWDPLVLDRRLSIGPTIMVALLFQGASKDSEMGWMVSRLGVLPITGPEWGEAARDPADRAMMFQRDVALLDDGILRYAVSEAP